MSPFSAISTCSGVGMGGMGVGGVTSLWEKEA